MRPYILGGAIIFEVGAKSGRTWHVTSDAKGCFRVDDAMKSDADADEASDAVKAVIAYAVANEEHLDPMYAALAGPQQI